MRRIKGQADFPGLLQPAGLGSFRQHVAGSNEVLFARPHRLVDGDLVDVSSAMNLTSDERSQVTSNQCPTGDSLTFEGHELTSVVDLLSESVDKRSASLQYIAVELCVFGAKGSHGYDMLPGPEPFTLHDGSTTRCGGYNQVCFGHFLFNAGSRTSLIRVPDVVHSPGIPAHLGGTDHIR